MGCTDAIRYPVGRGKARGTCLGVLLDRDYAEMKDADLGSVTLLGYVESRKALYLPEYCRLARQQQQFRDLQVIRLTAAAAGDLDRLMGVQIAQLHFVFPTHQKSSARGMRVYEILPPA